MCRKRKTVLSVDHVDDTFTNYGAAMQYFLFFLFETGGYLKTEGENVLYEVRMQLILAR
jgi:hypothetical protein